MNATAQQQFVALTDAHAIDPDELPVFEAMSEGGRAHFTRTRLGLRLREAGLPSFIGPPEDWRACADLVRGYMENEPTTEREMLHEAGVPVRGQDPPPGQARTRSKRVERMWDRIAEAGEHQASIDALADAGVPLARHAARPSTPTSPPTAQAALREAGVRLKEASAVSSAGSLERGSGDDSELPHRVVAALDAVVPAGHPDREIVNQLKRRGAALDRGEIERAVTLAEQHAAALKGDGPRPGGINDPDVIGKRWRPDDQEDDEPEVRESARASLAGAGVPMRAAAR